MTSKDEEVRQKILDSYKGRLYLCEKCGYVIVMYERSREKRSKKKVNNWCIMCNETTNKNLLMPEEVFNEQYE